MGRFIWAIIIERDENRDRWPWWVKWLIWAGAAVGLASFLIIRYIETGHV